MTSGRLVYAGKTTVWVGRCWYEGRGGVSKLEAECVEMEREGLDDEGTTCWICDTEMKGQVFAKIQEVALGEDSEYEKVAEN
jgi:hypothetical protein